MLHREPRASRRTVPYAGTALLGGLGALLGASLYARYVEPNILMVKTYELDLPSLPEDLDGITLAFLSDFHVGGPGVNTHIARRAMRVVERARPDLILLGGDYYDNGKREAPDPDWSRIPAVAPTFAVLGNHDYKLGPRATAGIRDTLVECGITVLSNEGVSVTVSGSSIGLVGVDDAFTGRSDFERADRHLDRDTHPRILLTHAGLLVDSLEPGSADFILSGHTHGGQVRFSPLRRTTPLDGFWWLDVLLRKRLSPYRQGLFYVKGSLLYVANGVGMTSLRLRFLAPPEVAFFKLRSGAGDPGEPCDSPARYIRSRASDWSWQRGS